MWAVFKLGRPNETDIIESQADHSLKKSLLDLDQLSSSIRNGEP